MELRHLRYFVAVAEELSFTKAARRLHLAQPSLTRQVRNLEEELRVLLLDRASTPISLTEEGRTFLFDSKKLLALCDESIAAVRRISTREPPRLNIGYIANIHHSLLPATLGAFRKLSPHVSLNLFDMTAAGQLLALDSHKIDLGFIGLPPPPSASTLRSHCIALDTILAALPSAHPLARKKRLKLSDLASQFFIGMSPATHPGEREWLHETCRRGGFEEKILQEADSESTAIKFVAARLGVAFIPRQLTSLPHEGVVFRPLSPPLRRPSTIAWRSDNPSKPLQDYIRIIQRLSL